MRSRTADDTGKSLEITRRSLVGATAAAPVLARERQGRSGEVLALARTWLALDAEMERVMIAWQDEESRLARDFGWLGLPEEQQLIHPEGRLMAALDTQLDAVIARCGELLEILESQPAADIGDIAGKVAVAAGITKHEEAVSHELLAAAVREMAGQRCRGCGALLIPTDLLTQG